MIFSFNPTCLMSKLMRFSHHFYLVVIHSNQSRAIENMYPHVCWNHQIILANPKNYVICKVGILSLILILPSLFGSL